MEKLQKSEDDKMSEQFEKMNDFELWDRYLELERLEQEARKEVDKRNLLSIPVLQWSKFHPRKNRDLTKL